MSNVVEYCSTKDAIYIQVARSGITASIKAKRAFRRMWKMKGFLDV